MADLVTAADVAKHMRMDLPSGDDLVKLQEHTTAASEWVVEHVGPLSAAGIEHEVWPNGCELVLPVTRLVAVTAITDPNGTAVDITSVKVDRLAGIVRVRRAIDGPWLVTASTGETKSSVLLATKIIAAHLWETQRGRGDSTRASMYAGGGDDVVQTASGYAIPRRAAQLLAPFGVR